MLSRAPLQMSAVQIEQAISELDLQPFCAAGYGTGRQLPTEARSQAENRPIGHTGPKKIGQMDHLTREQRSALMSRVRGQETLPERLLRSFLHRRGWRFRKNVKGLPGTPDIVFPSRRVVVFVDGDFWHGYRLSDWSHKLSPFWLEKIERNRRRD